MRTQVHDKKVEQMQRTGGNGVKVLLVGAEDEENLAIRYLGAVLNAGGHHAKIVPCSREDEFAGVLASVRKEKPQLIAVSIAFQRLAHMYFKLVKTLRENGFAGHLIVGGHFPTFEFQKILETQSGIDSVGRFEGEETISALADALASRSDLSNVPGLVYRVDGTLRENYCPETFPDLDVLPFPLRSTQSQIRLGENFATVVSSRGCWHSACLYCCIGAFHRRKSCRFALRSPENVARELASLVKSRGTRIIQFHDDNFVLATTEETLSRVQALTRALKDIGIDRNQLAFLIKARPDVVDERVADALLDFGCVGVFLGVENASATGLRALIRGATPDHVERSFALLHARGMAVTYNLLIFHPKATVAEIDENIDFVRRHLDSPFDFGRAEIVVGSPLDRLVMAEKLRCGSWPEWDYALADPVAERMSNLYRHTFRASDCAYSGVAHGLIALAYHAASIQRLYPGSGSDAIVHACRELTMPWNRWVLKTMEHMRDLVLNGNEGTEREAFRSEIDERSLALYSEINLLTGRMLKYQRTKKIFRFFGVEDALDTNPFFQKLLKW